MTGLPLPFCRAATHENMSNIKMNENVMLFSLPFPLSLSLPSLPSFSPRSGSPRPTASLSHRQPLPPPALPPTPSLPPMALAHSAAGVLSLFFLSLGFVFLFVGLALVALHQCRERGKGLTIGEEGRGGKAGWIWVGGGRQNRRYRYREGDELIRTASSRVYRGRDTAGAPVCVKVGLASGQLHNDGNVWTDLQHTSGGWAGLPSLLLRASLHDRPGHQALVSELCGESLEWCIARRRASDRSISMVETCALALDVLRHLRHVHAAGYVYRDVSLANFLLPLYPLARSAPLLYVIDFGIAQRLTAYTANRRQDPSGTLRFASVFLGEEPLGWRDDVQALGFLILACLAGSLPWDGVLRRGCSARQVRSQRKAVARAKLELLRRGSSSVLPDPRAAALMDGFFKLIDGLTPTDAPPYGELEALLTSAGVQACGSHERFPPTDLCSLLPVGYRVRRRISSWLWGWL